MAANVNARSAGGPCPLNSQLMFARVSRAMSPTRPKYQTATFRQLTSAEHGAQAVGLRSWCVHFQWIVYQLLGAGRDPTLPTVRALENTTCGADIQCVRIGRGNHQATNRARIGKPRIDQFPALSPIGALESSAPIAVDAAPLAVDGIGTCRIEDEGFQASGWGSCPNPGSPAICALKDPCKRSR